jgi:hypothetical protein
MAWAFGEDAFENGRFRPSSRRYGPFAELATNEFAF